MLILERFECQAKRQPEHPALVFKEKTITYGELSRMTDNLAAFLAGRGIGRGHVVSLLIPRCEYMAILSLGVLKAGAAYQPIDPAYPVKRIHYMINDAASSLVIGAGEYAGLTEGTGVDWMDMEEAGRLPDAAGYEAPKIRPDDLFVLLYTSGSTGEPKGCMLDHRNLASFADWYVPYYEADASCRMADHASFVFDVSMMELFMPLTAGAAVYIVPEEIRTDIGLLNEFFEENGITHTSLTTRLGRQFVERAENHSLRHLTVAGEALTPVEPPKNYRLHNGYGPTEGTILLTVCPVDQYYRDGVPIGSPLTDVEIYILGPDGELLPRGEVGELCAAGPHITRGYRNKPEQTALVYGKNPFSDRPGYETIYHTGDLACYNEEGLLMYEGRADRQVKIRGFRIEMSEVETVMRQSGLVADALAAPQKLGNETYLTAYYVSGKEIPDEDFIRFFEERVPSYMIPSFFVRLDEIPLNTNGKADHSRLPLPDRNRGRAAYEEPRTPEEKAVARYFGELLGAERVGRGDHFFRLGGHSLLAAELLFRLEREFQCQIGMRELMTHLTVAELAECVRKYAAKASDAPADHLAEGEDGAEWEGGICFCPASAAQKRMYTAQSLCGEGDFSYHLPVVLRLGELGRTGFGEEDAARVLCRMMERHESLRTEFCFRKGELAQAVHPTDGAWVQNAVNESRVRFREGDGISSSLFPFDMGKAPLFHWGFRQSGKEAELFLDWHHSVSDGISMEWFCREFMALAEGKEWQPQAFHYKDFALWERRQNRTAAREAWAEHLSGGTPALNLCLDYSRPAVSGHKGAHVKISLGGEESERIRRACRAYAVTEYHFLLAAFVLLLRRYANQTRITLGTVMSGRTHTEWSRAFGMFVNTLPVLAEVHGEESFAHLLGQVREEMLFVMEYQSCPLEEIAEEAGAARTPSGNLLFDVLFSMRGEKETFGDSGAQMIEPDTGTSMYDVTLEASSDGGQYRFDFEYRTDLFSGEAMQAMARHYRSLTLACAADPEQKQDAISFVSEEEKQKLLVDFQGGEQPFSGQTVVEKIQARAAKDPDRDALLFGESRMSYGELDRIAGRLADDLEQYAVRERFAAVFAARGFGMVASILGILYAGGAYVPVSPEYPADRILLILKDCQPTVILTSGAELPKEVRQYAGESGVPVIDAGQYVARHMGRDAGEGVLAGKPDALRNIARHMGQGAGKGTDQTEPRAERGGRRLPLLGQLAYMIYTSGTTGTPKGVMVEHAQLSHMLEAYKDLYQLSENDCVLQFANFVFDQSVWDIFHILTVGGTLCLIPPELVRDPEGLEEYCRKSGVTVASLTPGFLRFLHPAGLPGLRLLDVGGEAPEEDLLMEWSKGRAVLNTYGPTETTVNASSFVFDGKRRGSGRVPIGRSIPNTRIYILQGDELAGICVPGELCISGAGVTRGYWNREELTEEKYRPDPFGDGRMYRSGDLARMLPDGNIEFLGRIDDQVKLHGYRIELPEIEAHMREIESVTEAVAMVRKTAAGETMLCAYYTSDAGVEPEEMRRALRESLPGYMVPASLTRLDEIPLTVNGKIDKKALPEPAAPQRSGSRLPENEEERACVAIWEEILEISPLGTDSDFFECGGDSMKAIRILSRLRDLGYALSVQDILASRTIHVLAGRMTRREEDGEYAEEPEVYATPVMKSFLDAGMPHPEQYNQSVFLRMKKRTEAEKIRRALGQLVGRHGTLRLQWERGPQKDRFHIIPAERAHSWEFYEMDGCTEEEMEEACAIRQRQLDPEQGRMMAAEWFRTREADFLFLAIHHLAVDEVSWGILLEELDFLCGEEADADALPRPTASFGAWSRYLQEYGKSAAFHREEEAWSSLGRNAGMDPRIAGYLQEKEPLSERTFETVTRMAGGDVGGRLQKLAEQAYHTRLDAVLLAALAQAVRELVGVSSFAVWMESHGRGELHRPVRTDRTVGWFTAVYPVLAERCPNLRDQIAACKEILGGVPNEGIGYGIWRQREGKAPTLPGIVLNYLGREQNREFGQFIRTSRQMGEERDPGNGDAGTVSFDVRAIGEDLEIQCTYDTCFSGAQTEKLLDRLVDVLKRIAGQADGEDIVLTPSDLCPGRKMAFAEWKTLSGRLDLSEAEAVCTLTPLQQGMMYHWMSSGRESAAYHILDCVRLPGEWRPEYLRQAWELTALRHDVLRSRFVCEGLNEAWQIIFRKPEIVVETPEIPWEDAVGRERERRFDLCGEPLFRVLAFPGEEGGTKMLVSQHHLITDGWSFPVILADLSRYFQWLCGGMAFDEARRRMEKEREQACSFAEYCAWRDRQDMSVAEAYWQDYLDGYEGRAEIEPFWKPGKAGGEESLSVRLPHSLGETLRNEAREYGFTMSVLLETAWGILLQRVNGCRDVVFGKTVSGRNIDLPGTEELAGPLIHTVPVRVAQSGGTTFGELLRQQQEKDARSMQYEQVGMADLMKERGGVQTLFVYENYYVKDGGEAGCVIEPLREETDVPVTMCVNEESGEIGLTLFWDAALYQKEQMEYLMDGMLFILEQAAERPEEPIGDWELIPPDEERRMTEELAGETRDYPKRTAVSLLRESSRKFAGKAAVIQGGRSVSYRALHRSALGLAKKLGTGGERYVAVIASHSAERFVAVCGILYAGAAYVPLDPDYPWERMRYILDDCRPSAVVTDFAPDGEGGFRGLACGRELSAWLKERHVPLAAAVCLTEDEAAGEMAGEEESLPLPDDGALWNRAAYVIYTSGTTGRPKGVVMEHGGLSNMIYSNQDFYGFSSEDKVLQMANYVFDQSVMDIFSTLAAGGTLCLMTPEERAQADGIETYCAREGVTAVISTSALLGTLNPEKMGRLRLLDAGGDVASEEIFQAFGRAEMISNSYGPTETAVNATAYRYPAGNGAGCGYCRIPIGRPLANKKVYILQGKKLCGIGMKGEICIAGEGLAREYLNQGELTAEHFPENPFESGRIYRTGDLGRFLPDGNIDFCGRIDQQVKIRGYRIELSEIEECLRQVDGVREAAVLCVSGRSGRPSLAGFIVPGKAGTLAGIREKLSELVPSWMVPAHMQLVEELPLNRSGKLDEKRLLAQMTEDRAKEQEPPETYHERLVAELFGRILGQDAVGRKESFTDLGGTSLDAIKLVSMLAGYKVSIRDLTACPTPEKLGALLLAREMGKDLERAGFFVLREGDPDAAPLYCLPPSGGSVMSYLELLKQWDYPGTVYGMSDPGFAEYGGWTLDEMWEAAGKDGTDWKKTCSIYERELRKVWRKGGVLAGYSLGGSIAFRLASCMEEAGQGAGALLMLESSPLPEQECAVEESEVLETLQQMFPVEWGQDGMPFAETLEERKELLSLWAEKYSVGGKEDFLRTLLAAYLVIRKNSGSAPAVRGRVSCPIYDVRIASGRETPWREHADADCRTYDIPASDADHLVFLSKYKKEISEILRPLTWPEDGAR